MMRRRLGTVLLLLFLSACHVPPPEVTLPEVPAAPFVKLLEQRRQAFVGMKAVARIEIERKGRKRVYESVAILEQGFRKLKVEGYGPLGEPLFAILWDGTDILVRRPGETEPVRVGNYGLAGMLALPIAPADLCALLSGNVPAFPATAGARAGCGPDGSCLVDLRYDDMRLRVPVGLWTRASTGDRVIEGAELRRGDDLVFRSDFVRPQGAVAADVPRRVVIENPGEKVRLVVDYGETETGPVDDGLFTISTPEEQAK